jgi:hypothetical protein
MDRLRLDLLESMAARCGVNRVVRAVGHIGRMVADERESYSAWTPKQGVRSLET